VVAVPGGSADMVRRNAVRTVEEAHRRMLVDLMGRCGPDSLLVDRRPDGAGTDRALSHGAPSERGERRG